MDFLQGEKERAKGVPENTPPPKLIRSSVVHRELHARTLTMFSLPVIVLVCSLSVLLLVEGFSTKALNLCGRRVLTRRKLPISTSSTVLPFALAPVASAVTSFAVVTANDMIPGLPCQPLAVALAAKMGWSALPILIAGQSTAGILAFTISRKAGDGEKVKEAMDKLSPEMREKFTEFRSLGGDDKTGVKTLLALIALRLTPFFPFSAGNYLLGGGTSVGTIPFSLATVLGCVGSNVLSVGVGVGMFS